MQHSKKWCVLYVLAACIVFQHKKFFVFFYHYLFPSYQYVIGEKRPSLSVCLTLPLLVGYKLQLLKFQDEKAKIKKYFFKVKTMMATFLVVPFFLGLGTVALHPEGLWFKGVWMLFPFPPTLKKT